MSLQVNLHSHTEGSLLDGYSRAHQVVNRARELGQEYITFTDHGECNQHLLGAKLAKEAGIGFIPGTEAYWTDDIAHCRTFKTFKQAPTSHICLLAMTNKGLSNLWALSSMAYQERYHWYKPLADPDLLRQYSEGIYASDGCLLTQFAALVEAGDEDGARQIYGTLLDIYQDKFYVELHTWQYMSRQTAEHREWNDRMAKVNAAKVRLATEMGVPMVVVNDSHHAYPEHWENKELVWAVNTDSMDQLGDAAQKADHHMGEDEIHFWMAKHGISRDVVAEAIKNSHDIASQCKVEIKPTLGIPKMAATEREDLINLLKACESGFKRLVTDEGLDEAKYMARLEEEMTLISGKGFCGYLNMVRDYTHAFRSGEWAQYVKKGAQKDPKLIGPGRGSVGGSLVAYLTGIDGIDPVKYGTLFSRFLSPGRKGLPDVDVDVPQSARKDLLQYFGARFGHENCCAIGTLSHNGPKQTLKDVGRALGITKQPGGYADLEAISEHITQVERLKDPLNPDEAELSWEELIDLKGKELRPWKSKYPELFAKLEEMSGLARHAGVHAAGILVSSTPLLGAVPMRRTKKFATTTQVDMWDVEFLGGVKLDLLGIRHLDSLSVARQLIYERHGVWIDYDRSGLSVPEGCTNVLTFGDEHFKDPAIWEAIDRGETCGIFQVETANCTEAAIQFKPRSEVDVADLTSIIRPGVADAGLKDVYLRRRAGLEPVTYDHFLMEKFVGPGWATDTRGVLVYQEQLIECVQQLAGFTADEADDLRKATGKKLVDKMLALKDKFFEGCLANPEFMKIFSGGESPATPCLAVPHLAVPRPALPGQDQRAYTIVEKIWGSILASARYAFNWSHAVGYAIVSSWEVWTKHYYPQEFITALLATDAEGTNRYIRDARRHNITVLPPDVNLSSRKFTVDGEAIRYGLDTVRSIGAATCRDILAARPFASLDDYLKRAKEGSNKTAVYNLIIIGAFDSLGDRVAHLHRLERYRAMEDLADSTLARPEKLEEIVNRRLQNNPTQYAVKIPDFSDPKVVYEIEKELVGTYVTVDPMSRYLTTLDRCAIRDPLDMMNFARNDTFIIGGQVSSITKTTTKKGRSPGAEMAHMEVMWNEVEFRIVIWPEDWKRTKLLLEPGAPVACEVKKLDSGCCLQKVERLDLLFDRKGLP